MDYDESETAGSCLYTGRRRVVIIKLNVCIMFWEWLEFDIVLESIDLLLFL